MDGRGSTGSPCGAPTENTRRVLQERLAIFWANIARVRKFIQLTKGYDPHMTNIDQSPYHKNEAGSQGAMTLNLKGASKVVLKEGHADARARWTSNATICSDFRGGHTRLANPRA